MPYVRYTKCPIYRGVQRCRYIRGILISNLLNTGVKTFSSNRNWSLVLSSFSPEAYVGRIYVFVCLFQINIPHSDYEDMSVAA